MPRLFVTKLLQRFFSGFLKLILGLYFEEVIVRGRERCPSEGPAVLAGNHPNMLMDPVLVAVNSNIASGVAIWAKATLFRGFAGTLLSLLGAVPVQRHKDQKDNAAPINNDGLFSASVAALREKRALMLFPEGVSYTDSHIQPLKTGAARVIQEYEDTYPDAPQVPIIPCGLSYINKHKYRSHCLVEYGSPIYLDRSIEDKKEQVRDLTDRLESSIYDLTINAVDMPTLMDLRCARRIYVDGRVLSVQQHVDVQKKFAQFYEEKQANPEVLKLKDEVRAYREKLESLSIHDWQVLLAEETNGISKLRHYIMWKFIYSVLLLPFAVFGVLMQTPAFLIGRYINKATQYVEEKSQAKLLTIAVVVPLQHCLILAAVFWFSSTLTFLAVSILLPVLSFFLVSYVSQERQSLRALTQLMWLSLLLRNSSSLISELMGQRRVLKEKINGLAKQFLMEKNETSIIDGIHKRDVFAAKRIDGI